jgi:hypothetical protein
MLYRSLRGQGARTTSGSPARLGFALLAEYHWQRMSEMNPFGSGTLAQPIRAVDDGGRSQRRPLATGLNSNTTVVQQTSAYSVIVFPENRTRKNRAPDLPQNICFDVRSTVSWRPPRNS